jgi:ribonuclease HI
MTTSSHNPVPYRGPSGDVNDPEVQRLVAEYRAWKRECGLDTAQPAAEPTPEPEQERVSGIALPALFCDGGVIGPNPSAIGGTWAWCLVDEQGLRTHEASGVLLQGDVGLPTVTNNVTELYALILGCEALPAGWRGTICSDSWISLQRVFRGAKLNHVPLWLCQRLGALLKSGRLTDCTYELLDGHPTRAELERGVGKRGHPVSEFNVWCDSACTKRAREVQHG